MVRPYPWLAVAALLFASLPAAAESGAPPPPRATNIIVYGNDPCPKGSNDEIVVCARRPEEDRYRIPKELRDKKEPGRFAERSWADRVAALDDASRYALPGYCSPVGADSQIGCWETMIRQWQAARDAIKAEQAGEH
ncbi:MAG TPA: hypothetical protein VJ859_00435 [Allosphingosinicella sp.]|nr:hypothetical protein [Allosphingosinicella sp.]